MSKDSEYAHAAFRENQLGDSPIAWVIESAAAKTSPPYLTVKHDVAIKRIKAGDHVTAYYSKRTQEDEL